MSAVPVSELGLNATESRFLQQQIAASQQGSNSSRAVSHASSQGRLLLDPSSLQALSAHFDRLMYSIQQRWQYVRVSQTFPQSAGAKTDPSNSSRSRPLLQHKFSTTAPVTPCKWPMLKSPASRPSSAKSTSYKLNSTRSVALAKSSKASNRVSTI